MLGGRRVSGSRGEGVTLRFESVEMREGGASTGGIGPHHATIDDGWQIHTQDGCKGISENTACGRGMLGTDLNVAWFSAFDFPLVKVWGGGRGFVGGAGDSLRQKTSLSGRTGTASRRNQQIPGAFTMCHCGPGRGPGVKKGGVVIGKTDGRNSASARLSGAVRFSSKRTLPTRPNDSMQFWDWGFLGICIFGSETFSWHKGPVPKTPRTVTDRGEVVQWRSLGPWAGGGGNSTTQTFPQSIWISSPFGARRAGNPRSGAERESHPRPEERAGHRWRVASSGGFPRTFSPCSAYATLGLRRRGGWGPGGPRTLQLRGLQCYGVRCRSPSPSFPYRGTAGRKSCLKAVFSLAGPYKQGGGDVLLDWQVRAWLVGGIFRWSAGGNPCRGRFSPRTRSTGWLAKGTAQSIIQRGAGRGLHPHEPGF